MQKPWKTILYISLFIYLFLEMSSFLTSCSDSLPERYIGVYKNYYFPDQTIEITSTEGDFITRENNGRCIAKGKFKISDFSKVAESEYYKLKGFNITSKKGCDESFIIYIDFKSENVSIITEGEWPHLGQHGKTQAISLGSGVNGGDGGILFKVK